jgi:DUF1009 family protein
MTALPLPDRVKEVQAGFPVAIICGGGALPFAVADAALARGRPVYLLGIKGWADARALALYPHDWIVLGQFGRLQKLLVARGCRDVVFIGALLRPALRSVLRSVRLDFASLQILPEIFRAFRGGDDHLLTGIGRIFEKHGFHLIGAHELAPEILAAAGAFGARHPGEKHLADARRGFALIDAIAPFDVGQAVVVTDNRIVAVEAAEGTDAMLSRIIAMRDNGRITTPRGVGVLVKAAKRTQDRRFDLPSIGPATIDLAARAGLAGIALRAGEVIVAEPDKVVAMADAARLFVAGVPLDLPPN